MELKFTRRFSMAHRLLQSGSAKCKVPHGHNELVTARLSYTGAGPLSTESNIAADFADLKTDWHRWIDKSVDHAFQLGHGDPLISYFKAHEPQHLSRILVTPGDPSTECLAVLFLCKYRSFLNAIAAPFKVTSIELQETPTNAVVVTNDDLPLFQFSSLNGWWNRPDLSINEFDRLNDGNDKLAVTQKVVEF